MGEDFILNLGGEAIKTIILISAPMLIAAMLIGIIVSVLQAITQINESTLTFIPKMLAVVLVIVIFGPWMLEHLQTFASNIFGNAGEWVR